MVLQKDQYTKFSRKKIQSRLLHILKFNKVIIKLTQFEKTESEVKVFIPLKDSKS